MTVPMSLFYIFGRNISTHINIIIIIIIITLLSSRYNNIYRKNALILYILQKWTY